MALKNDFKTLHPLIAIAAIYEFSKNFKKGKPNECWLWTGATDSRYGTFLYNGINIKAHRFAYLAKYGHIDNGNHIHHKCENLLCVNVKHLKSCTPAEHKRIHARMNGVSMPAQVPWYRQKAERPKVNKTFSIYEEHSRILDRNYQGQQSALVRLLMDRYFGGQLPEVAAEFEKIRRK